MPSPIKPLNFSNSIKQSSYNFEEKLFLKEVEVPILLHNKNAQQSILKAKLGLFSSFFIHSFCFVLFWTYNLQDWTQSCHYGSIDGYC